MQVLAVTLAIIVVLLLIGVAFYDIELPTGADWITFAWVTALGVGGCTLLGIAVSSLAKNGRSASATVTPFALVLQFISGVFFRFSQMPTWMQTVAAFFPLKWMAPGAALGVPARRPGGAGAGRLLGAGPGRTGARRLVRRGPAALRRAPSAGRTGVPAEAG